MPPMTERNTSLSSLPQLMDRGTKLYSIAGTPPSLYNEIVGDAFAPRNPYCLRIDTLREPPMFRVTDTHYAKTWLLDPRAEGGKAGDNTRHPRHPHEGVQHMKGGVQHG